MHADSNVTKARMHLKISCVHELTRHACRNILFVLYVVSNVFLQGRVLVNVTMLLHLRLFFIKMSFFNELIPAHILV